jgi:hypothetical protein
MDKLDVLSTLSVLLGLIGAVNALVLLNMVKREKRQDEIIHRDEDQAADLVLNGRHLSIGRLSVGQRRTLMRKLNELT